MFNDTPSTTDSIPWHSLAPQVALQQLDTQEQGLNAASAKLRLRQHGFNRFATPQRAGFFNRLLHQFHHHFIYILLLAATLTLMLQLWLDTLVILGVVVLNIVLGLLQERRTAKTLEAVQRLLSPTAPVLRDGQVQALPAEQLVPGDVVLLEAGNQVPADVRLLHSDGLQLDESVLMGYSAPVLKGISRLDADTALPDRSNMAYAGTLVLAGQGRGVVVATGSRTELGMLNALLDNNEPYATPLGDELKRLMNAVALVLAAAAALILLIGWLTPGVSGHSPQGLLQAMASFAVAIVPEGLPALFAIMLAISVRRLARQDVMVRQLAAVETLGTVSVVCTDKSHTLTRHELTVQKVITPRGGVRLQGVGYAPQGALLRENFEFPEHDDRADLQRLAQAAVLASDARLQQLDKHWQVLGDPLDGSLLVMAHKCGVEPDALRQQFTRLASIPFDRTYRYAATLSQDATGAQYVALKGAPEAILPRCSHVQTDTGLEPLQQDVWEDKLKKLAEEGMKPLVIASRQPDALLQTLTHQDVGYGMVLLGVVGIGDPPQASALAAVQACQQAGLSVKMLTGDHALTACALAKQVGIGDGETVLTGADLDALDEDALRETVMHVDVFARLRPEQKLRLVKALQANGERVVMLGGGVNDTPALEQADVGVAPAIHGTEAARQSAEIVLMRDQLPMLMTAVQEGRKVFQNFYKMVQFMLPTNGAQAAAIILASWFGLALPLMPVQVLWVNLVTAGILALTLAFEKAALPAARGQPIAQPVGSLISGFLVWRLLLVSGLLLVSVLAIFHWELQRGETLEAARTAALNTLVIGQIFYLLSVRHASEPGWQWASLRENPWLLAAIVSVLVLQGLFTYMPAFQGVFGTDAIDLYAWFWIVGVGSLVFVVVEFEKAMQRNVEGWGRAVLIYLLRHFDPRFWREKGLRWTLQFFLIIFLVTQALLMFLWSRDPDTFDVRANARQMVGVSANEPLRPGVITTATLAHIANTLLDKPGGYLSNDVTPPGIVMDNIPNWELGVLTQLRDMSLAMRDDLSRSQSQSAADPDLVRAQLRFNTDGKLWLFPPAESQFNEGAQALEAYLQRLQQGQAQFYARSDNLNNWLNKVQRQMGSLSIALSASVGIRQVKEEGAAMQRDGSVTPVPGIELQPEVLPATDDPNEVIVKTPRLKVDDVFYQARGQTWALLHLLKAIEADFEDILRQKNALVSLRQIINKLEDTQAMIWSPVILNGSGYSFVANHSLVMASQISRANAALIDLGTLLREG
ncbi:MAG: HAD-IC family P-type ATPase [Candidatus Thiothrix putei]|uniref:HAD-IC family P-type ATPase n=1 Tax=Candidatus Thiothrix putei TaxID=3080811 RepID=A0AA95HBA0_9GAMM|nr:MAG: HAD-IC family P-type ATPase [Candidatus Thiothrix putei]